LANKSLIRTRDQIMDALGTEFLTMTANPRKGIITSISTLKQAGEIELVGKLYRVTASCTR
jgi:hypothetical protein